MPASHNLMHEYVELAYVELAWLRREVASSVSPGAYALREPEFPCDIEAMRDGTWRPTIDWGPESAEISSELLGSISPDGLGIVIGPNTTGMSFLGSSSSVHDSAFLRVLASMLRGRSRGRRVPKNKLAQAVEQLIGAPFRPLASCFFDDASMVSARILAEQFYLAEWRDLVESCRERAQRWARTLATLIKRFFDPAPETGSAAAIARRMNPLGAPPQYA